jgi:hypothetical protein
VSEGICLRLKAYPVSDTYSAAGSVCGRSAVGEDAEGTPACAIHLAADKRAKQRREQSKRDFYRRLKR